MLMFVSLFAQSVDEMNWWMSAVMVSGRLVAASFQVGVLEMLAGRSKIGIRNPEDSLRSIEQRDLIK